MADDQVERRAVDGRRRARRGRVAVVREGRGAAVVAEPDHDLVGLGARGRGAEEGVVGDVGDEGGAGVADGRRLEGKRGGRWRQGFGVAEGSGKMLCYKLVDKPEQRDIW